MATIRRFIKYWRVSSKQSLLRAKQSHTMTLFCIALIIAVLSWNVNFRVNPTAQAIVKWISSFGATFWLLVHIFWVPFRRHEEQENTIENQKRDFGLEKQRLDAEIQRLNDEQTRLIIEWRATPPCSEGPRCRLEIKNTNGFHAAQNVRAELIGIEQPPRSLRNPVYPVNLPRVRESGGTINPNCAGYFELFELTRNAETLQRQVVIRTVNGIEQRFDLDDPVEQALHGFYTLVIRASSAVGPPTESRFELRFPTRGNDAFYLDTVRQA
jgi:hypothetical protein